jgi:hypothetical protein
MRFNKSGKQRSKKPRGLSLQITAQQAVQAPHLGRGGLPASCSATHLLLIRQSSTTLQARLMAPGLSCFSPKNSNTDWNECASLHSAMFPSDSPVQLRNPHYVMYTVGVFGNALRYTLICSAGTVLVGARVHGIAATACDKALDSRRLLQFNGFKGILWAAVCDATLAMSPGGSCTRCMLFCCVLILFFDSCASVHWRKQTRCYSQHPPSLQ